jgi:hypothetical protein
VTRGRTIWAKCKECAGNSAEVRRCEHTDCPLCRYRTGGEDKQATGVRVTRQKAIRGYCKWCVKDQEAEIRLCPATDCQFYPFRGCKVEKVAA